MNNVKFTLRQARNYRELRLDEAAEKIGISSQTLSSWEKCLTFPNSRQIPAILLAYGMEIDDIIFGTKLS